MIHLKPKMVNHELDSSGKVVYVLEVTDEQTGRTKVTKLRYSSFRGIHDELAAIVDKLKLHIILPEFPGRRLLWSTNKSEESVFERKKELNNVNLSLASIWWTCSRSRNYTASICSNNTTCLRRVKVRDHVRLSSTSRSASIGTLDLRQLHTYRRCGHLLRETP